MIEVQWLLCPICGNKTRLKIRKDTILENFPLYCPKCKQESLINVLQLNNCRHCQCFKNNRDSRIDDFIDAPRQHQIQQFDRRA